MIVAAIQRLLRRFDRRAREVVLLDHLPVVSDHHPDVSGSFCPGNLQEISARAAKYQQKLIDARARYGKAFKCAAPDQDREVMIVPGEFRKIGAGRAPTQQMVKPIPSQAEVALFHRPRAARGG